ncbi:MAG: alpha/beta fold hydrolase [Candidatus Binatia bacterium]
MRLEEWQRGGKTFDHNGHPIFYRDEGDGPVLVCIHGFPTASWDWHKLWPDLTQRFRVIAIDMIGFGFSAKPRPYAYSIHDQATIHDNLLHQLEVDFVHILAHNYGDTVAQALLARYEERRRTSAASIKIESLCLLNGGLFPEAHRPRLVQKLLLSPVGPAVSRLFSSRRFRRSLAAVFGPGTQPSDEELKDFWSLVTFNDGLTVTHKLIRYIKERRRYRARWVGALQSTHVPVRLISGTADPVSGVRMAARYRQLIPKPDVVLLEGIGHYPQLEDPASVLRAYLEFVEPLLPRSHE